MHTLRLQVLRGLNLKRHLNAKYLTYEFYGSYILQISRTLGPRDIRLVLPSYLSRLLCCLFSAVRMRIFPA